MKKYVLTGGPSVGKTTVIKILASKGFFVVPEQAIVVIKEERAKKTKNSGYKFMNNFSFQERVAEKQLFEESKLSSKNKNVFLDRGLFDGLAYCNFHNIPIPKNILENRDKRYNKIFILEPTGIYKESKTLDNIEKSSKEIHELIREVYVELGYDLISVPLMSPVERAEFILKHI
jgi:predicted ATPase